MKGKGYFFGVLIFLGVLVTATYYIFTNYGKEILDSGKSKIIDLGIESINKNFEYIEKNEYSDSLKTFSKNFMEFLKENKNNIEFNVNKIDEFVTIVKVVVKDSIIDSTEYQFIKNSIKMNYEPRKKD